MAKNLPRNWENEVTESRKRPSKKLTDGPRNLVYDPNFKGVEERIDKCILPFEKVISRDQ